MHFSAIGLMSGTSLDGLDICYASFEKKNNTDWSFKLLIAETLLYDSLWENKLRNAMTLSAEQLCALHSEYGFYLGQMVKNFIDQNQLTKIDVIASHGHTVFHQPQNKFTLQIGDGRAIKILNSLPVVYDFRSQDVLMGGNGAPLVPIGDQLLFSEYDACLNLGGFSNISFIHEGKRIAFDICPVNMVMNYFAEKKGEKFDKDGQLASAGTVNQETLETLNNLKFYQQAAPKSLGAEWVITEILPKLNPLNPEDALATFTAHIAEQIAKGLTRFGLKNTLVTGGGAYNKNLIEEIQKLCDTTLVIPSAKIVNFKEALIFALMGVLRINGENNVLSTATGSPENHCSGILV